MAKYENKNEVIGEAIKILESDTWSMYIRIKKAVAFLKENFDIEEKNNGEWLRNSKK